MVTFLRLRNDSCEALGRDSIIETNKYSGEP